MTINDIRQMPTEKNMIHESVFRSYHILEKVESWLSKGVPAEVILDLVSEMKLFTKTVFPPRE